MGFHKGFFLTRKKRVMISIVGLFSIFNFLFSSIFAYGATTNFVARTLVGSDTTPPSVPLGLTATPVATSQINLVWGTSTDDFSLSGYQVFRDDVQIATTGSAFYEDTGLTASTTYTYFVTAFDSFNNISASSSPVSTTTLASSTAPTTTPDTDTNTTGSRRPSIEIRSIEIIPGETTVLIRYETREFVRSIVQWGVTSSYETGSSAEQSFRKLHEIFIRDLRPDTRYRFSIGGEESYGRERRPYEGSFKTLPSVDATPPGVVTGFTLTPSGNDVVLSWDNPTDADFDHVRVVRSERFYPTTEIDGWVVYDGSGEGTTDRGVLRPNTRIYYAVFAYDARGNVSAPAVASLYRGADGVVTPVPVATTSRATSTIELSFDDIVFFQDRERIPVSKGKIELDGSRHITVAVPYTVLPEHLKTILVRIVPEHDRSKELSFLLRVNEEKTAYVARLAPLGIAGTFTLTSSVFDFETREIAHASGTLLVYLLSDTVEEEGRKGGASYPLEIWHVIVLLLALLFILLLIVRMLREEKPAQLSNEGEK